MAVVAIGGYGRRHLCLHSDLDLLVLFGDRIGEAEEAFLRALLHPLWDAGVVVGHQVRELDDFATLERDNPEFLLALVDARHVAGRGISSTAGTTPSTPPTRTHSSSTRCTSSPTNVTPGSTAPSISSSRT